ncbi:MAG: methyltransferase domain-containing protein [Candidatus Binatia bacterium]
MFEHVPNPEQAFREARRVTRDNGLIFLLPAWNCVSWAAEG